MGDVKLTARATAAILTKLDESLRNVSDARQQVIQAMADRRTERPAKRPAVSRSTPARPTRKRNV